MKEVEGVSSTLGRICFFGATGDLAYKKFFPALQAMVRRGHFHMPVIAVAKRDWTSGQLRDRARESLEKHGGVGPDSFAKFCLVQTSETQCI